MPRLRGTVTVQLAIGYGILVVGAMAAMAAIFYIGTVGMIERGIDTKLRTASRQLSGTFERGGVPALEKEIHVLLTDNIDQDTEDYLLLAPDGSRVAGNISTVKNLPDGLSDQNLLRYTSPSESRIMPVPLPGGYTLVVGHDLSDLAGIRQSIQRSLVVSIAIAFLLAIAGAVFFRRQLEERIATIRRTAHEIDAGNLSRRIPEDGGEDEFTKLNHSINQMLDRIQHLVDGVRDVSNAIAHDLRTPLGRIRSQLDEALAAPDGSALLAERARGAIRGIDELTMVFDKLLQIAEAESGARRQSFRPVALANVIRDVVELYDATAEVNGISLVATADGHAMTLGDKDLLVSAVTNLVDNALKYVNPGSTVAVRASRDGDTVSIAVEDNGPGIPTAERDNVMTRFYRLDRSRSLPGNGLGLPIVKAISQLHGGAFVLGDAAPGLIARIVLPRLEATRFIDAGPETVATASA